MVHGAFHDESPIDLCQDRAGGVVNGDHDLVAVIVDGEERPRSIEPWMCWALR
jgi:hypothetical protein